MQYTSSLSRDHDDASQSLSQRVRPRCAIRLDSRPMLYGSHSRPHSLSNRSCSNDSNNDNDNNSDKDASRAGVTHTVTVAPFTVRDANALVPLPGKSTSRHGNGGRGASCGAVATTTTSHSRSGYNYNNNSSSSVRCKQSTSKRSMYDDDNEYNKTHTTHSSRVLQYIAAREDEQTILHYPSLLDASSSNNSNNKKKTMTTSAAATTRVDSVCGSRSASPAPRVHAASHTDNVTTARARASAVTTAAAEATTAAATRAAAVASPTSCSSTPPPRRAFVLSRVPSGVAATSAPMSAQHDDDNDNDSDDGDDNVTRGSLVLGVSPAMRQAVATTTTQRDSSDNSDDDDTTATRCASLSPLPRPVHTPLNYTAVATTTTTAAVDAQPHTTRPSAMTRNDDDDMQAERPAQPQQQRQHHQHVTRSATTTAATPREVAMPRDTAVHECAAPSSLLSLSSPRRCDDVDGSETMALYSTYSLTDTTATTTTTTKDTTAATTITAAAAATHSDVAGVATSLLLVSGATPTPLRQRRHVDIDNNNDNNNNDNMHSRVHANATTRAHDTATEADGVAWLPSPSSHTTRTPPPTNMATTTTTMTPSLLSSQRRQQQQQPQDDDGGGASPVARVSVEVRELLERAHAEVRRTRESLLLTLRHSGRTASNSNSSNSSSSSNDNKDEHSAQRPAACDATAHNTQWRCGTTTMTTMTAATVVRSIDVDNNNSHSHSHNNVVDDMNSKHVLRHRLRCGADAIARRLRGYDANDGGVLPMETIMRVVHMVLEQQQQQQQQAPSTPAQASTHAHQHDTSNDDTTALTSSYRSFVTPLRGGWALQPSATTTTTTTQHTAAVDVTATAHGTARKRTRSASSSSSSTCSGVDDARGHVHATTRPSPTRTLERVLARQAARRDEDALLSLYLAVLAVFRDVFGERYAWQHLGATNATRYDAAHHTITTTVMTPAAAAAAAATVMSCSHDSSSSSRAVQDDACVSYAVDTAFPRLRQHYMLYASSSSSTPQQTPSCASRAVACGAGSRAETQVRWQPYASRDARYPPPLDTLVHYNTFVDSLRDL